MVIGVSAEQYRWRDLEEAVRRAVDEFGLDLVEFDAARLQEEDYPKLGILSQEYGVMLGLHARLDCSSLSRETAVAQLQPLSDRCQEAMSTYLALDLDVPALSGRVVRALSGALEAVRPVFERIGVRLCVNFVLPPGPSAGAGGEEAAVRPASLSRFLYQQWGSGPGTAYWTRGLGCVYLAGDDWLACLPGLRETGFNGPYVLCFPEGGELGYREAAELLRATVAA